MSLKKLYFIIIILSVAALNGCASVVYSTDDLPYKVENKFETEQFDPLQTPIGSVYAEEISKDPSISGAMLISSGSYALLHRIALVRMATKSIELQTYIYENDITSIILMQEMKAAADRGVKVRILVDDLGLDSDHSDIMLLNYHPNIEVKIFNPFKYRARILKYPQLLFDLGRLNYRMHNKLFIVDSSALIIGGRNVAGNYFDDSADVNFSDTDALFLGKIVQDAVDSFDEYWNYHKAIPVSVFPDQDKPEAFTELNKKIEAEVNANPERIELYNLIMNKFTEAYNNRMYPISWGQGIVIGDTPDKTDGNQDESPITGALRSLFEQSTKSVYVASAYFVPGKEGNKSFINAAINGVDVNILTNSLSSTDVGVVYAGWMRYRDDLLKNGVHVFEFRNEGYKVRHRSSSGASLHSKTMVFDDNITVVGSFNLDPRSASLDTEVVALFRSKEFTDTIKKRIEDDMSDNKSWLLTIKDGDTVWQTERDGTHVEFDHSPDTSWWTRFWISIVSVFVPESML